jgi:hypothetical protein
MNDVEKILIERDGMTPEEAKTELNDMTQRVWDGENPEEVLYEIGLEPDYIFDLIG